MEIRKYDRIGCKRAKTLRVGCLCVGGRAQAGLLKAGEVLAKRGHMDIVSTRGATMVGTEGKFFWNLDPPDWLKMPFPGLIPRKSNF